MYSLLANNASSLLEFHFSSVECTGKKNTIMLYKDQKYYYKPLL